MGKNLKVHVAGIAIILVAVVIGMIQPPQMQGTVWVSLFGFIALVSLLLVLATPLLFKVNKGRFAAYLMTHMRWTGIYTFVFGLIHVILVLHLFFAWNLAMITQNIYIFLGGIAMLILALMAATSNDASVRKLGRNWKRLHRLVYIALFLALLHSFNVGQIFMKELWVQAVVAAAAVIIVAAKLYGRMKRKAARRKSSEIMK